MDVYDNVHYLNHTTDTGQYLAALNWELGSLSTSVGEKKYFIKKKKIGIAPLNAFLAAVEMCVSAICEVSEDVWEAFQRWRTILLEILSVGKPGACWLERIRQKG